MNNSKPSRPAADTPLPPPVVLRLRGLGNVPAHKNNRLMLWAQKRSIRKPEIQEWMDRAITSLVSQLRSEFTARGIETSTGPQAASQIASCMPLDDCFKWIRSLSVSWQEASSEEDAGADITITRVAVPQKKID